MKVQKRKKLNIKTTIRRKTTNKMDKNWDNNNNTCVSVLCVSKTVSKIPISNCT